MSSKKPVLCYWDIRGLGRSRSGHQVMSDVKYLIMICNSWGSCWNTPGQSLRTSCSRVDQLLTLTEAAGLIRSSNWALTFPIFLTLLTATLRCVDMELDEVFKTTQQDPSRVMNMNICIFSWRKVMPSWGLWPGSTTRRCWGAQRRRRPWQTWWLRRPWTSGTSSNIVILNTGMLFSEMPGLVSAMVPISTKWSLDILRRWKKTNPILSISRKKGLVTVQPICSLILITIINISGMQGKVWPLLTSSCMSW